MPPMPPMTFFFVSRDLRSSLFISRILTPSLEADYHYTTIFSLSNFSHNISCVGLLNSLARGACRHCWISPFPTPPRETAVVIVVGSLGVGPLTNCYVASYVQLGHDLGLKPDFHYTEIFCWIPPWQIARWRFHFLTAGRRCSR